MRATRSVRGDEWPRRSKMCDDLRPDRGARVRMAIGRAARFKNHTEQRLRKYQMLIGGKRVDAVSDQWIESFNPYTGKPGR